MVSSIPVVEASLFPKMAMMSKMGLLTPGSKDIEKWIVHAWVTEASKSGLFPHTVLILTLTELYSIDIHVVE